MKRFFLWLSGLFSTCFFVHFTRVLLRIRIDINLQRMPLKVSVAIGFVAFVLAVIFYLLSREKKSAV